MQNRQNDALPDRKDASRHTKRKANKNQKRNSGLDQTHPVLRSQIWVELREKIDNEQSQDVRKMKREYRPEGFAAHPSYGPQPSHIPLRTEAHQRRKGSCAEKETKIVNFPARTQGLHEPSLPDKQMLRALPQRFPERKVRKMRKSKEKKTKRHPLPSSLLSPTSASVNLSVTMGGYSVFHTITRCGDPQRSPDPAPQQLPGPRVHNIRCSHTPIFNGQNLYVSKPCPCGNRIHIEGRSATKSIGTAPSTRHAPLSLYHTTRSPSSTMRVSFFSR